MAEPSIDPLERIAAALERIARTAEHVVFGQTVEDVREATRALAADIERQLREKRL